MGTEYNIRFPYSSTEHVDALLRRIPGFSDFDPTWRFFNYRGVEQTGAMPAAHVRIEPHGVYFCDNGGGPVLPSLLAEITSTFGAPVVEKIEE